MKKENFIPNKEWLYKKYWDEKLSTHAIAKLCDVSHTTAWQWLKNFGIKRRTRGEANMGKHRTEAERKKMSIAQRKKVGKNSPNWKGGRRKRSCGYIFLGNYAFNKAGGGGDNV